MLYILTLTWNACDKLVKLHDSLMPSLHHISYKWLIKDNASNDKTIETINSWEENVKVLPYKDNKQNFAAGMNYLFAAASPADNDLIMLLNNDVIFNDTSSIKNMMSILHDDVSVGAVGARLLFTGTNKLQHAGVVFHPFDKTPRHFRSGEVSDDNAEKNRVFQVVTGAVLLTKAEYFRKCFTNASGIKGMDENYHWAFDDVDLCLSIGHNMKKKIVYCGNTNIFHEESSSLKKNPVNKLFLGHNLPYFLNKWADRYSADKDSYILDPKHNLYRK
jgi:O-antigen biosynthesis protein